MPEARPDNNTYHETRLPLLSQGDIFRDIPLAYPVPGEIIEDDFSREEGKPLAESTGEVGRAVAVMLPPRCGLTCEGLSGPAWLRR